MAKNLFNSIKLQRPKKNVFDLTHDVKLTTQMGKLTPIMCTECIPGDSFTISCDALIRFAPLVAPVMHRFDVFMHYFFVPNRILWDNWENYITNTPVGASLPAFPTVTMDEATWAEGSLADYLGIPPPLPMTNEVVSALPFAAYTAIWNEYYRDQNMQLEVDYTVVDGDNLPDTIGNIRYRCWEHDYFTSALPFAQKGNAVNIPGLFNDVPVVVDRDVATGTTLDWLGNIAPGGGTELALVPREDLDLNTGYLYAKTSEMTTATINDLRRAFRVQEWLERSARSGSRYAENILGFFGVKPQDARLQRPEYITGTRSPVIISEVLNTTGTDELPQGNMAGHGVSVNSGRYGKYFCQEHGYIIGIMSIMPKTAYQQGIPKHFLKTQDPFQFYWPQFANIGEQEVLNKEVFAYQVNGNETFGYVPRYSEYKFENNRVAGQFRTSQDFWHAGRIFDVAPVLNDQFVVANPTQRIFAVTDPNVDQMICHVLNKVKAVRGMPMYGTPSF